MNSGYFTWSTARLKCDGTRAETRFSLSAKRTSPFKLAPGGRGGSVQSTTGSRGVRISGSNGSNAGYTIFWGRVQDYWLPIPLACFPFTSPTVRHHVPSGFNWALLCTFMVISRWILKRYVSDKRCSENKNTHLMFKKFCFPKIVPFIR